MEEPIGFMLILPVLVLAIFNVDWVGDHASASQRGQNTAEAAAEVLWERTRDARADPVDAASWQPSPQEALAEAERTAELGLFSLCAHDADTFVSAVWLAADGTPIPATSATPWEAVGGAAAVRVHGSCQLATTRWVAPAPLEVTAACWDSAGRTRCAAGQTG